MVYLSEIAEEVLLTFRKLHVEMSFEVCNGSVPKKNASCIANIVDIFKKLIPLCSTSSLPTSKTNSISLAPLLLKICLAMSVGSVSSVRQIKNK